MIRRPPRSTLDRSSAASDVYKRQEYDALTKEIDHSEEQITKLTAENDALADSSKGLSQQVEDIKPKLDELLAELSERQADLKEIVKANEVEETKLLSDRKHIEEQVKKPDLSVYMRIRKAKKGKAVSTIKRSACSGCHNIVCLLYTSPSPRDRTRSRMPSSA